MALMQSVALQAANDQYVLFNLDQEVYGLPVSHVREIIRPPAITSVPLAPAYVEGVTNLRGAVLQVINGRRLLGMGDMEKGNQTRIIVLIHAKRQMGYVVDRITGVATFDQDQISNYSGQGRRWISGVAKRSDQKGIVLLLDPVELFGQADAEKLRDTRNRDGGTTSAAIGQERLPQTEVEQQDICQVVRFKVGKEDYGLPISDVRDIVRLPERIDRMPEVPDYMLGVGLLRGEVLPILQMSRLLGFTDNHMDQRSRVVLIQIGEPGRALAAGLVVDSVSEVLRLRRADIQPLPDILQNRRNEAIAGVCRLDAGRQLIYLLELRKLIDKQQVNTAILGDYGDMKKDRAAVAAGTDREENQGQTGKVEVDHHANLHLIFRLGAEEFGLPVWQVREILRVPDIAAIPHTPAFLTGIANIRGQLIPVVNLRQRLGMQPIAATNQQRIIITEFQDRLVGLIVDSVREARKVEATCIEQGDQAVTQNAFGQYLSGIAKMGDERIVLLLQLVSVCEWQEEAGSSVIQVS